MPPLLSHLTDELLAAAKAVGAQAADAIAIADVSVSIDVRAGALEQAERAEGTEIGLRVLMGRRQACVSASDLTPRTMAEMAERAVAMAREAPEDPGVGLADPGQLASGWDIAALELNDPGPEPDPEALQDAALALESAAADVAGVTQVQSASAAYGHRDVYLAATNGFYGGYQRSQHSLSAIAISGDGTGMERDYNGEGRIFRTDLPDPSEIGRIAGERAVALQGATRARTGSYPVIYDERVASGLIGHLVMAINGSAIARGSSWARDLLGRQVLPDDVDLIEDPHRPRISGSRPFDAEGLPTSRRRIVENGVLQSWTLDLATARKLDMISTANAARGPSSPPQPGITNLEITQGHRTKQQLMSDIGTGLLVTSLIGSTINPNTGDYSRGASGFWIENGEISHPVNEITIAGNLRDMLPRMQLANDARPHLSRVVPSILIEGMTLAGD